MILFRTLKLVKKSKFTFKFLLGCRHIYYTGIQIPFYSTIFSNSSRTDGQEHPPIVPINQPVEDATLIDPKEPGAYEKIRQRNIAEREKRFCDLKISQMKTGISNTSK